MPLAVHTMTLSAFNVWLLSLLCSWHDGLELILSPNIHSASDIFAIMDCINLPTDTDLAKGFVLEDLPVLEYYKDLKSNVYFFLQYSRCIIDTNAILFISTSASELSSVVWLSCRT